MLLPDVNVLLAGFRSDHPHHGIAASFLAGTRSGSEVIGLVDSALASVVRLATNARVFVRPDTTAAALDYVDALLDPPGRLIHLSDADWTRFTNLCRTLGLRGNLVPDGLLASVSLEQRATLITFDRGFGQYPGLTWRSLLDE